MDRRDAEDELHGLIIKLEYLVNAHYGFLTQVNEAFDLTERDTMGFSNVFEGMITEFKTYKKELSPLL